MAELPDLESLRLLVLVGERGSLTAAAAAAGISQPSASKRVAVLERRLGVSLLDRSPRGSSLTTGGALVAGWALTVLEDVEALLDGVGALQRRRDAELSLAASMTVAEHLLPGWIGELRRSEPDLHVGLQVLNSTRVVELVRSGAVDLGFVEGPGVPVGLHTRVVGRDRLVLVVAPGHRWARRTRPVGPRELAGTALVVREDGSGTRRTAEDALRAAGVEPAPPLLELGSSAAVRAAVAAGAGPALLSALVVAPDVAAGLVVDVPTEGVDLERALRAVWRGGPRPAQPAARLLAVALRARARRNRTSPSTTATAGPGTP